MATKMRCNSSSIRKANSDKGCFAWILSKRRYCLLNHMGINTMDIFLSHAMLEFEIIHFKIKCREL